jgi:hypothetical protein
MTNSFERDCFDPDDFDAAIKDRDGIAGLRYQALAL